MPQGHCILKLGIDEDILEQADYGVTALGVH